MFRATLRVAKVVQMGGRDSYSRGDSLCRSGGATVQPKFAQLGRPLFEQLGRQQIVQLGDRFNTLEAPAVCTFGGGRVCTVGGQGLQFGI